MEMKLKETGDVERISTKNDILSIQNIGGRFSRELGIELHTKDPENLSKWWLTSILFGARIGEKIAINTYKEFENRNITLPQPIIDTGWDGLVQILDAGGYVRYDFKTATKLLDVMGSLIKQYNGDLNFLHESATSSADLELRLKDLGKGIGDTTVNIFLRELRDVWEKANPSPQPLVLTAAKNLGISISKEPLQDLKSIWNKQKIEGFAFSDFEVALLRLAKNYCNKNKCQICSVKRYCIKYEE